MKNRIKLISIIMLIAFQYSAFGQLQRANKNFELYRFSKAIPMYKKLAKSSSEEKRNEALVKLADCYRHINNPYQAKSYYVRVVEQPNVAPVNYLYLGQSLTQLEEYAEAKVAFEKYAQLAPDDTRGALYATYCEWAIENKDVVSDIMEVKNAKALNTKWSEFSPVMYNDGIVFSSDRVNAYKTDLTYKWTDNDYLDLYVSKPAYFKDFYTDMTAPVRMADKYQTPYHDGPIVFSNDESKVVISRTVKKNVKKPQGKIKTYVVKLFFADISVGASPKFKPFYLNSDEYSCAHPTLTKDGKTMFFSSDKPGGKGESDIYMCKWENDSWANAVSIGEVVNTVGNEVFPTLVNDSILIFASNGHAGFGGLDLFISYKTDEGWSKPQNLMKPLNSSFDDFGALLMPDLSNGFLSSNRPAGAGLDDIYAFRNFEIAKKGPKKVQAAPMNLMGYVKDKATLKPIEKATVFVYNPQNGKVKILKTDPNGLYQTTVDRPADYLVKAMQTNYVADCLPWEIAAIEPGVTKNAPRDLLLDKLDLNRTFVLRNIYYDFDKYFIRDDAKPDLEKVIRIMQENPNVIAELSSHTDSRASFTYNNTLSQNRANAAVEYIVTQGGIMPGRILARGYGEYQLTNKCKDGVFCSEEDHQLNRRTEFKVIGFSSPTGRGQFDPNKFIEGEEIDIRVLPDYFFEPCDLEVKEAFKPNTTTTTTPTQKTPDVTSVTSTAHSGLTPGYHIVGANETLYSVSKKYGITVQKLKELNNLSSDKIILGQKLKVK